MVVASYWDGLQQACCCLPEVVEFDCWEPGRLEDLWVVAELLVEEE